MSAPAAATATLAGHYEALRARIAAAGDQGVTVIAVTKALGAWAIEAAAACGIGDIGENYAQECVAKIAEVSALPRPRVHFIGRLQRNKVKVLAGCVDVWQTVDRVELAREIGQRAPGSEVMIQVNISGEASKGGCAFADTELLGLGCCRRRTPPGGPDGHRPPRASRGGPQQFQGAAPAGRLPRVAALLDGHDRRPRGGRGRGRDDGPSRAEPLRGASPQGSARRVTMERVGGRSVRVATR